MGLFIDAMVTLASKLYPYHSYIIRLSSFGEAAAVAGERKHERSPEADAAQTMMWQRAARATTALRPLLRALRQVLSGRQYSGQTAARQLGLPAAPGIAVS